MRTLSTVLIKSGSFTGSFSGSSVNVTTISSSYGYFGLNAVVNGILRVFDVVYAYAGVVGSVTGSLSGSKIIVNELTASNLSVDKIILNQITASSISSSYIITSQLTASNGSFTDLSASVLTSQTASFNYLSINNTGSAPTNITSPGSTGEIRFDNNFIYIYTNENWLRVPIAKWN